VLFLFMMVFMDTTATIVTGACAERWSFKSFCLFSVLVGAFIYPVFGGWVWGGGWLAQLGYRSGLGHGAGRLRRLRRRPPARRRAGVHHRAADRPRIGKYGKDGKINAIKPHHIPMVMLGTFILAFGWFGFNAGSSLAGGDGRIGIVATNTMLGRHVRDGVRDGLHVDDHR
jgi:Amt family ammonium transporter